MLREKENERKKTKKIDRNIELELNITNQQLELVLKGHSRGILFWLACCKLFASTGITLVP